MDGQVRKSNFVFLSQRNRLYCVWQKQKTWQNSSRKLVLYLKIANLICNLFWLFRNLMGEVFVLVLQQSALHGQVDLEVVAVVVVITVMLEMTATKNPMFLCNNKVISRILNTRLLIFFFFFCKELYELISIISM